MPSSRCEGWGFWNGSVLQGGSDDDETPLPAGTKPWSILQPNLYFRTFPNPHLNFILKKDCHLIKTDSNYASQEREAEIYDSIPDRLPETIYAGRGVLIYSPKIEVLKHLDLKWWKKSFPGFKQIGFPGGHLFPLEAPEKLGNLIQSILIDLTEEHVEKSDKPLFEVA